MPLTSNGGKSLPRLANLLTVPSTAEQADSVTRPAGAPLQEQGMARSSSCAGTSRPGPLACPPWRREPALLQPLLVDAQPGPSHSNTFTARRRSLLNRKQSRSARPRQPSHHQCRQRAIMQLPPCPPARRTPCHYLPRQPDHDSAKINSTTKRASTSPERPAAHAPDLTSCRLRPRPRPSTGKNLCGPDRGPHQPSRQRHR